MESMSHKAILSVHVFTCVHIIYKKLVSQGDYNCCHTLQKRVRKKSNNTI